MDSKPTKPVAEFMATETRFKFVRQQNPEHYEELVKMNQAQIDERIAYYTKLAE
jgi:pyruvate/2-oxoacid:ferredoxin oxidoreductase beta subunit